MSDSVNDEGDTKTIQPTEPADNVAVITTSSAVGASDAETEEATAETCKGRAWRKFAHFYDEYEFLILIVLAILFAQIYPPLGAEYLAPKITATWIAVVFIFILAGLSLRTDEFTSAFKQVYFNVYIQLFNFGLVSGLAYAYSRVLISTGALIESLADGMVICACTPMAINMVLILTKNAGGDEASAIFNATFSNMIGVFLSPLLILGYLGTTGDVDLVSVFYKLLLRIVLPLVIGQIVQKTSKAVVQVMNRYKIAVKKAQIYALVFIVYTVFCETFAKGNDAGVGNIFLMLLFQFLLLMFLTVLAWFSMNFMFPNKPELIAMGIFGANFKTVSVGVPLINAMYEGNDNVGLYTLPLLIWHPMQLVLGSVLVPRVHKWVVSEQKRLAAIEEVNASTAEHDADVEEGDKTEPNEEEAVAQEEGVEQTIKAGDVESKSNVEDV